MFIIQGIICQAITVLGIFGNIINCIVFVKQGFSDNINVSLLGLTISDLCSLICIMWTSLFFIPVARDTDLFSSDVHVLSGTLPHIIFTRITGWITAFISLERCVCVIKPLKVKTMFTRKRHFNAMIVIYAVTIASAIPAYVSIGLEWTFFPAENKSRISLIQRLDENGRKVTDALTHAVSGVLIPVSCVVSVVVLTTILVVQLNKTAAWRKSVSPGVIRDTQQPNAKVVINNKEMKIAKMVVIMSLIFIASFFPAAGIFLTEIVEPTFNYDKLNRRLVFVTLSVSFTLEVINSSVNTFVYFRMSTKYRETFLKLFRLNRLPNGYYRND
ncbi:unnamed protein product [Candidula unifasciata]|uniref:G-protein coupled receptors family 1 profile domain-containing protein n=1 Tax=Candidula unifasciata TaxID=100452 RepID=A0A8S4A1V2_9EUPU|nr:unnamed protein product [Candidula unifasciata]